MSDGSDFRIAPIGRVLNVEGTLGRKKEPFRGLVIALGWSDNAEEHGGRGRPMRAAAWQQASAPDMHYLVSDMDRPAPIWVSAADITRQYHGGTP